MPVAATARTEAGAQAFAAFFVRTIDWGYATTSSAYMRHYFVKSCTICTGYADASDKYRLHQEFFVGARISTNKVAPAALTGPIPADYGATVSVTTSAYVIRDASLQVTGQGPSGSGRAGFGIRWLSAAWQIVYMTEHHA